MKFFKEIKNPVTEAPHYPEDPEEWNAMFGARKKKAERDPEDHEPRPTHAQQAADDEEALGQKLQAQQTAFAQKRQVKYVDQEGSAPNGQRYNKLYVINAKDMQTANHEEYLFDKHEWGAKKVVDTKKEQNEDGSVTATLYIVDNHKYGMWKPWKNMPAKEGVSADALEESKEDSPVLGAIIHRIMVGRTDLLSKYGPQLIMSAAQDVADWVGDVDEIGSSDVSGWVKQVERMLAENPPEAFGEGVAEGAPELLKKEMPLHRHAEKLLAQNGVSKDDPDYHHHLNNTIKHLRQFGNIDLINKSDEQGVSEGSEQYDEISDKAFDDGYAGYSYRNVYPKGTREYEEYHEGWYDGRLAFEKANDYESDFYISRPEQGVAEVAGAQKCWPGYRKTGTQPGTGKNAGKRVNDCEKIKEDEVDEAAKHGLYYNVNKRKKAGTSRPASSPKAPTAQAWRDAAKTAKTEGAGAQQAAIAIAKKESGNYTKTGQRKK